MVWHYPTEYDVVIIGGGHAGCEAAHAAAKMGAHTLLLTLSVDTIAKMSCNPAIGGIGKGHMVREIDALGGLMGLITDETGIQFRMLNSTKGPAVWAPRAQVDRYAYQHKMRHHLEKTKNLEIKQGTCEELIVKEKKVVGVTTKEGTAFLGKTLIISSGTFMRGLIHIGESNFSAGRAGDISSMGLSKSLEDHGIILGRLKTGTPPRVHSRSIDYSHTEEQPGEEGISFSYDSQHVKRMPQVSCYITYTAKETQEIVAQNIHRSPLFSGKIQGIGPRYCPSIEDKVVRFKDKERHQIFLEPEGLMTEEVYCNGISTSLPFEVQMEYIRSIPALKNAEVIRPAYAIEYDYAISGQISSSLECRSIENLFFAGQINGTTGYEEAAGQGLIAGINAVLKVQKKPAFTLKRSEAYIGVMIDDLITKELVEPYRMFTSRAEHRLLLRQDNAIFRLRHYGHALGLIDDTRYQKLLKMQETIKDECQRLEKIFKTIDSKGSSLAQMLRRPEMDYQKLVKEYPEEVFDHGEIINQQIELHHKYQGYISRQTQEIERLEQNEKVEIPPDLDYYKVTGLRREAQDRLTHHKPENLGQASRISGVSPADISVLLIHLKRRRHVSSSSSV